MGFPLNVIGLCLAPTYLDACDVTASRIRGDYAQCGWDTLYIILRNKPIKKL